MSELKTIETVKVKPKVYIHLIRHGQAEHNYNAIRWSKVSNILIPITNIQQHPTNSLQDPDNFDASKNDEAEQRRRCRRRDTPLTTHGKNEALDLRDKFPFMDDITHILTSPLRRTLQTTLLALEPAIKRGIRPIALEFLREIGMSRFNWGSHLETLLEELGELGKTVLTNEIMRGWEVPMNPMEKMVRANLINRRLKGLAELCQLEKEERASKTLDPMTDVWQLMYDLPLVEKGKDIHIAVVSHGGILDRMIRDQVDQKPDGFGNAEFRTYVLGEEAEDVYEARVKKEAEPREEDEIEFGIKDGKVKGKRTLLIETEESKNREHEDMCEKDFADAPWSIKIGSEDDLPESPDTRVSRPWNRIDDEWVVLTGHISSSRRRRGDKMYMPVAEEWKYERVG
ncbi:hypothetical protein VTL71DRAFT_6494 [Oculimacula yallundae]|uniref:Phosphoglycerate mutase n=1 Tax=Oculimacula yallundae TaxID=86028 RepID=A0ABR4BZQ9_9HELO